MNILRALFGVNVTVAMERGMGHAPFSQLRCDKCPEEAARVGITYRSGERVDAHSRMLKPLRDEDTASGEPRRVYTST